MNAASSTKRMFATALALALVSAGACGGLFFYVSTQNAHSEEIENGIALEVKKDERLRTLKTLLQETEQERGKLDAYFVGAGEDGVVAFIERIEGLGSTTNTALTVQNVNVAEAGGEGERAAVAHELLQINISAEGSWREMYHLLSLIEALPYRVFPGHMTLERSGGPGGTAGGAPWRGTFNFSVAKLIQ